MVDYKAISDKYLKIFFDAALPECLTILRGYIPIDTRELQGVLDAYRDGDIGILEVKDKMLDYSAKAERLKDKNVPFDVNSQMQALVLANILEVGMGTFHKPGGGTEERPLKRSRTSDLGLQRKTPTEGWWRDAIMRIENDVLPPLIEKYYDQFIKESVDKTFLENNWRRNA